MTKIKDELNDIHCLKNLNEFLYAVEPKEIGILGGRRFKSTILKDDICLNDIIQKFENLIGGKDDPIYSISIRSRIKNLDFRSNIYLDRVNIFTYFFTFLRSLCNPIHLFTSKDDVLMALGNNLQGLNKSLYHFQQIFDEEASKYPYIGLDTLRDVLSNVIQNKEGWREEQEGFLKGSEFLNYIKGSKFLNSLITRLTQNNDDSFVFVLKILRGEPILPEGYTYAPKEIEIAKEVKQSLDKLFEGSSFLIDTLPIYPHITDDEHLIDKKFFTSPIMKGIEEKKRKFITLLVEGDIKVEETTKKVERVIILSQYMPDRPLENGGDEKFHWRQINISPSSPYFFSSNITYAEDGDITDSQKDKFEIVHQLILKGEAVDLNGITWRIKH